MADVELSIGGRRYKVACKAGGEDRLREVARYLDQKAAVAIKAVGSATEERTLLMAALLVADELHQLRSADPPTLDPQLAAGLTTLAERLETLADGLEADSRAS